MDDLNKLFKKYGLSGGEKSLFRQELDSLRQEVGRDLEEDEVLSIFDRIGVVRDDKDAPVEKERRLQNWFAGELRKLGSTSGEAEKRDKITEAIQGRQVLGPSEREGD